MPNRDVSVFSNIMVDLSNVAESQSPTKSHVKSEECYIKVVQSVCNRWHLRFCIYLIPSYLCMLLTSKYTFYNFVNGTIQCQLRLF